MPAISQIISIVIIIVSFISVIYFIVQSFKKTCPTGSHFDSVLNKCSPNCKSPQVNNKSDGTCECPNPNDNFIGGQCIPKCPDDKPDLCNNQCYNTLQYNCTNDNTVLCPQHLGICGDDCCIGNTTCDEKTSTCVNKPCKDPQVFCGDDGCCDPNSCIKDNKKNGNSVCCSELDGKEICGTGSNQTCCLSGKCCTATDGTVTCCDSNQECKDGKCMIKCEHNGIDKNGNDIGPQYCDPNPSFGKKHGDQCVNITRDNVQFSYCGHNNCVFNHVIYHPSVINNPHPTGNSDYVDVCKTEGDPGKFYSVFDSTLGLTRTETSDFDLADSDVCNENDCINRLSDYATENTDVNISNSGCSTNFNCQQLLAKNPNTCPYPDGNGKTQCCFKDNGTYTGQLCPVGQVAAFNGQDCDCIGGWVCTPGANGSTCTPVPPGYNATTFYTDLKSCQAACKCNPGWRWNKSLSETPACNDFLCKDNMGRNRPDVWNGDTEKMTCHHKFDSSVVNDIANKNTSYHAIPAYCDMKCDDMSTESASAGYPGYGIASFYGGFLNCIGTALDVTGAEYNGTVRQDQFPHPDGPQNVTYYSGCPDTLSNPGSGNYPCESANDANNKIPTS